MFKKLFDRKAQNTAEYAILIALVVGAVIAMQTYVQRAMNGRVLDTTKYMANSTAAVTGADMQYEPYYKQEAYDTSRSTGELVEERGIGLNKTADTASAKTGNESSAFTRGAGLEDFNN